VERLHRLAGELAGMPEKGSVLWRMLRKPPAPPRGIYMWGGVGRGKSMLMDLFFSCVTIERKRRVHFHEFMIEVHARLRAERAKEKGDPIAPVVAALAAEARSHSTRW
jgi:cell division protein ZapE